MYYLNYDSNFPGIKYVIGNNIEILLYTYRKLLVLALFKNVFTKTLRS